ncbi:hypothetical protein FZ029_21795 [Azospirillum sp. Sh1]|nr:hypothetical protein FZ029_21795 [Azospirillum sp. Sh1]
MSPSPPWGEGRGEGDALRAFPRVLAARPPHPNPLPGGERGSSRDGRGLRFPLTSPRGFRRRSA